MYASRLESLMPLLQWRVMPVGRPFREKLHALKGDLKATVPMGVIGTVISQMDQLMANDRLPRDFSSKWLRIQKDIEAILAT